MVPILPLFYSLSGGAWFFNLFRSSRRSSRVKAGALREIFEKRLFDVSVVLMVLVLGTILFRMIRSSGKAGEADSPPDSRK